MMETFPKKLCRFLSIDMSESKTSSFHREDEGLIIISPVKELYHVLWDNRILAPLQREPSSSILSELGISKDVITVINDYISLEPLKYPGAILPPHRPFIN